MTRLVVLVLLAAWVGAALLTATVVAPAAFDVLPTRAFAGAMVGRVLPPLFVWGAGVGTLAVLAAWRDRTMRLEGAHAGGRSALGGIVVAACLGAQLAGAARIERVREAIGGPVDALPTTDARRIAFGRLHAISVTALGVAMLAGGVLLVLGVLTNGRVDGAGAAPATPAAGR